MNIALPTPEFVTEDNFNGGLANYTYRIAVALDRAGHRPVVFTRSDRDERLQHAGITVYRVDCTRDFPRMRNLVTLGRFCTYFQLTSEARAINRTIRDVHRATPFDIVHYPHLGAMRLSAPEGIPVVIRLSGHQRLWNEMGDACLGGFQGRQQYRLETRALRRTEHLFAPSAVIAEYVSKEIGRPVEVIEPPFFVETTKSDESVYRERLDGKRYLMFVGTLNRLKGIEVIAEALERLLAAHPDLYFILAGADREYAPGTPMSAHIKNQAGAHAGRVIYLGVLKHEQLYPVLGRALAVVLPSRIDNLPNACMEAMGHKRVVIGTRGASFDQLLTDGESGFLCATDDPDGLLHSMERALALSGEERDRMGEAAYRRVQELAPGKAAEKLTAFYEKAIRSFGKA